MNNYFHGIKTGEIGRPYVLFLIVLFLSLGVSVFAADEKIPTDENLNGVLWMQYSPEYRAISQQTYSTALSVLPQALKDSTWTAATEQTGSFDSLPPAIIVDVDETVLDNSPFQAELVTRGIGFDRDLWKKWCSMSKATAIPGALEFLQKAKEGGVEIFYVTNRDHSLEKVTRENLKKQGFPLSEKVDTIFTKNEQPDWSSNKTSRRAFIAQKYRIIMLCGDNFGDFLGIDDKSQDERIALYEQYTAFWGTKWFMLANPTYGSWLRGVSDVRKGKKETMREKKYRALITIPQEK